MVSVDSMRHNYAVCKRVMPYVLPSAVLIVVALLQRACVVAHHLDPWVAGGFSMFAYVDNQRFRFTKMHCIDEHGQWFDCTTQCTSLFTTEITHAAIFPKRTRLNALANRCLDTINTTQSINGLIVQVKSIAVDGNGPSIKTIPIVEVAVNRSGSLHQ